MKLTEYCDALNVELRITYYPVQAGRWTAAIDGAEIKDKPDSGVLASTYGNGKSPELAAIDYVQKITGKIIVLNAMSYRRREFTVPKALDGFLAQ